MLLSTFINHSTGTVDRERWNALPEANVADEESGIQRLIVLGVRLHTATVCIAITVSNSRLGSDTLHGTYTWVKVELRLLQV